LGNGLPGWRMLLAVVFADRWTRRHSTPIKHHPIREGRMSFRFVFLPAQPALAIVLADDEAAASAAIVDADAAFGRLHPQLLARARKLRWLQSPQIAPPAGYYYPELVAHPLVVTNMREVFNDHIGAHIMAYVLAFARGLHYYIPQQLKGVWQPRREDTGVIHLPESTALIVGLGGIGTEAARLAATFGITVIGTDARRE